MRLQRDGGLRLPLPPALKKVLISKVINSFEVIISLMSSTNSTFIIIQRCGRQCTCLLTFISAFMLSGNNYFFKARAEQLYLKLHWGVSRFTLICLCLTTRQETCLQPNSQAHTHTFWTSPATSSCVCIQMWQGQDYERVLENYHTCVYLTNHSTGWVWPWFLRNPRREMTRIICLHILKIISCWTRLTCGVSVLLIKNE